MSKDFSKSCRNCLHKAVCDDKRRNNHTVSKSVCKHYIQEAPANTNFARLRAMSVEELAMFLMKVNCAYGVDCMYGMDECKHPNIDNNCAICFKEYLESKCERK